MLYYFDFRHGLFLSKKLCNEVIVVSRLEENDVILLKAMNEHETSLRQRDEFAESQCGGTEEKM